jgi:hypothetical protein
MFYSASSSSFLWDDFLLFAYSSCSSSSSNKYCLVLEAALQVLVYEHLFIHSYSLISTRATGAVYGLKATLTSTPPTSVFNFEFKSAETQS